MRTRGGSEEARAGTRLLVGPWAHGSTYVFLAGHQICVLITSSSFPRFDRNPNTGSPLGIATLAMLCCARGRRLIDNEFQ